MRVRWPARAMSRKRSVRMLRIRFSVLAHNLARSFQLDTPVVYGSYPDMDDLFSQQARELDASKRAALLQQIQRLVYERVMFIPIWELALYTPPVHWRVPASYPPLDYYAPDYPPPGVYGLAAPTVIQFRAVGTNSVVTG